MSRCKCCDVPLTGHVRYKTGEEFDGLWVEEDMCTACIFITETVDYMDVKSYQFEDITEGIFHILNNSHEDQ